MSRSVRSTLLLLLTLATGSAGPLAPEPLPAFGLLAGGFGAEYVSMVYDSAVPPAFPLNTSAVPVEPPDGASEYELVHSNLLAFLQACP